MKRACLCILLAAAPAAAETPAVGDTCTIGTALKMSAKPTGGAQTKLKGGTRFKVLATGASVHIDAGKLGKGYLKESAVSTWCTIVERAAAVAPVPAREVAQPVGPESQLPSAATASPAASTQAFSDSSKIKVAVTDFTGTGGLPGELVQSLNAAIPDTLDALGPFDAISNQEILRIIQFEADRQALGCEEVKCLTNLGNTLGADFLVAGNLTQAGTRFVIQLQLIDIRQSRVADRATREYTGYPSGLFEEVRAATRFLVRGLLGQHSGTLRLAVSEEGATIRIDDAIVAVSPADAVTVSGGPHTLQVEKDGFIVYKQTITITENRELALDVRLLPSAEFIARYEQEAGFTRLVSWVGIGAGVVAIGAGAALYVTGRAETEDLNERIAVYNAGPVRTTAESKKLEDERAAIATRDAVAITAGIVGAAALGVGVALRLSGGDPDRYQGVKTSSGPMLTVGPGGLSLSGSF